ncbi:uncharacterized protein METZ01_LOCUS266359, partial [marine metagenome]
MALDDGLAVTSPCERNQHTGYRAHRTTLGDAPKPGRQTYVAV